MVQENGGKREREGDQYQRGKSGARVSTLVLKNDREERRLS